MCVIEIIIYISCLTLFKITCINIFVLKMASTSTSTDNVTKECFFLAIRGYPPVINGRINIIEFIDASTDLVAIVERLGTIFAPVKYDMQGNVDKIKKLFTYDKNSCLLELVLAETATGKPGAESVLWLNRGMLFFEIVFTQILCHVQTNNVDVNMKKMFTVAYEGSVKKYHNWVTQQIFNFICKMSPSLPDVIKAFEMQDNLKLFGAKVESLHKALHLVRFKIDDFFKENNIFNIPIEKITAP